MTILPFPRNKPVSSEVETTAEHIVLQPIVEAQATPRPTTVDDTWLSREYDQLAEEQLPLWKAEGLSQSRTLLAEADSLEPHASTERRIRDVQSQALDSACHAFTATNALAPYRRRKGGAPVMHWATKGTLLFADSVGISSALIWLGEEPMLAVMTSMGAATATVVAGSIGADLRHQHDKARRVVENPEDLDPPLRPFAHLFRPEPQRNRLMKLAGGIASAIAVTVATGIFALRSVVDEPMVGMVFGGIAAAIAAASFIESWAHADDIADHIDAARSSYQREQRSLQKLSRNGALRRHRHAASEAASIQAEYEARGEAAARRMTALKWGIYRRNPAVLGHGEASPTITPKQVGRVQRSSSESRMNA
ncbi:hypothetical protein [Gulosibacter molinativorax]|nr:hypothetical protein [Gulosibacter molinativorax]QUY62388.1 Hypotetical protein [Gulosibacter molinativorax]